MKYELVYIINPALEEDPRKELIARFSGMIEQNGGTVDTIDEWGKRRLAYPINDLPEGYYVLVRYTAPPTVPKEIERNMGITDNVLRYLTTRIEEKTTGVKPRTARITPAYPSAAPAEAAPAETAPAETAPVEAAPTEAAPTAAAPAEAENQQADENKAE